MKGVLCDWFKSQSSACVVADMRLKKALYSRHAHISCTKAFAGAAMDLWIRILIPDTLHVTYEDLALTCHISKVTECLREGVVGIDMAVVVIMFHILTTKKRLDIDQLPASFIEHENINW